MTERVVTVAFTTPKELKTLLEKWAEEEDRPVSSILRQIIKREAQRRKKGKEQGQ